MPRGASRHQRRRTSDQRRISRFGGPRFGANHPRMGTASITEQPDVGLKDLAGVVVRIADAIDRAVTVLEEVAVRMDVVHPDDVGPTPTAQKIAEA
jgi:hypothetical protein